MDWFIPSICILFSKNGQLYRVYIFKRNAVRSDRWLRPLYSNQTREFPR